MIDQCLEELENIIPKSLFSKIEVDRRTIYLQLNSEFEHELGKKEFFIYDDPEEGLSLSKKDSMKQAGWQVESKYIKSESLLDSIYKFLDCKLIELSFQLKTYDVWGNEEDGYEVNDIVSNSIFKKEVLIYVPTITLILSKKDIIQMLYLNSDVELEWSDFGFTNSNGEFYSWGYFINDENGKPLGEVCLEYSNENIKLLDTIR